MLQKLLADDEVDVLGIRTTVVDPAVVVPGGEAVVEAKKEAKYVCQQKIVEELHKANLLLPSRNQVLRRSQRERGRTHLDRKVGRRLSSELGQSGFRVSLALGSSEEQVVSRGGKVDEGRPGVHDRIGGAFNGGISVHQAGCSDSPIAVDEIMVRGVMRGRRQEKHTSYTGPSYSWGSRRLRQSIWRCRRHQQ